jgi:hypothetical protein
MEALRVVRHAGALVVGVAAEAVVVAEGDIGGEPLALNGF